MATKKKTRKIKKNKGNKMDIKIDFSTPKKTFANNIIVSQQQEKLFKLNRLETIEEELRKYDINITQEEIIQKYESCLSIDDIITEYNHIFENQLNNLTSLNILFDDNCILFYVSKAILQYQILNDVPNPEYIVQDLLSLHLWQDKKKTEILLKQLKLINRLKDYTKERNLSIIFEKTNQDIEWILSDILGIEIHNLFLNLETIQEITDEVFKLLDTYNTQDPEYLYCDALGLLAQHGYEAVKDKFEEGLNQFPNNKIRFYNSILCELHSRENIKNNYEIVRKLYKEAISLKSLSTDDKENLKMLHENFDHEFNLS